MPPAHDFSLAPVNRQLTAEDRRHFYKQMIRIRAFETMAIQCYQAGQMGGFLIAQIGQESIPVAMRSMMEPQDHVIGGLRGMGTTSTNSVRSSSPPSIVLVKSIDPP